MQEKKEYTLLSECNTIIEKLTERYPKIFWAVNPKEVAVFGVTNKERPKKQRKKAQIKRVTGAMEALLESNNVKAKYIVETFCSDWTTMSNPDREWLIAEQLLHIPGPDEKGLIKEDVQGFAVIYDAIGMNLDEEKANRPSLLIGDPIKFNEDLAARLHENSEKEDEK